MLLDKIQPSVPPPAGGSEPALGAAGWPPGPHSQRDREAIARLVAGGAPKLVVLDDDPTGTQTVHGIPVLTEWSVSSLEGELRAAEPGFFILTNSRSLAPAEAARLNREIATNLGMAAARVGCGFSLVSRSDSTLRGHFPLEVEILAEATGGAWDGLVLIPAFFEGGRITVDNVHYLVGASGWTRVGETEFARDATFGYRESDLCAWVEEKTGGRVARQDVAAISLADIRTGGAASVQARLQSIPRGRYIVVNAADYGDMEVFVHGLLLAEATGRRYLLRTAASFVRVRAAIEPRGLLQPAEIRNSSGAGGLVVVGSYVQNSTRQLEQALAVPGVTGIELRVDHLGDVGARNAEEERVAKAADSALGAGSTAVVFTSRNRDSAVGRAGELGAGRVVSAALVAVLQRIGATPRYIIAKGGITSSDLAVRGLGVRRATVLGQAVAGVPVWQLGAESRFPGIRYVVFPGNVGGPDTLANLVRDLKA